MGYLSGIGRAMPGDGQVDLAALAVLTGRSVKALQRLAERGRITHHARENTWPYRKLYLLREVKPVLGDPAAGTSPQRFQEIEDLRARNMALREELGRAQDALRAIAHDAEFGAARCVAANRRDLAGQFDRIARLAHTRLQVQE